MKIALPDQQEQHEIVNSVELIREENKKIIEKIDKEIFLMKEYRHSLITDLITGKKAISI